MIRRLRAPMVEGRATSPRAALVLLSLVLLAAAALGPVAGGARASERHPTGPAFALDPQGATGSLRYFVLHVRPGQTLTRQVRVSNLGDRPGNVLLYAVDATTGQTSGAVYQGDNLARQDVGAWTRLGRHTLRLAPGQAQLVNVRIHVPKGVAPGTHLGGIVAESRTLAGHRAIRRGHGSFRIRIRNLTVTAVQLELPGPRTPRMGFTGTVQGGGEPGGHQAILVGLQNSGDMLLKPTLSMHVDNSDGRQVQVAHPALDTFVPRTQILYPVPVLGHALPPGRYMAHLAVDDRHGHVTRANIPFTISAKQVKQVFGKNSPLAQGGGGSWLSYLPWVLAVLFAVAAAILYRRQRHASMGPAASTPPEG